MSLFRFWQRKKAKSTARPGKTRLFLEHLEDRMMPSVVTNPIVAENQLAGTPQATWDVGPGNDTIDGFTTSISYNAGQTVNFKINTPSTNYLMNIYRMGYYQGDGARLVASENIVLSSAQVQPDPIIDPTTGLEDCGNWQVSATWSIPTTAVSGVYFADVIRQDGVQDHSMIFWVVRNDASTSAISFMTSDTTWEAYNEFGNGSLYVGSAGFSATYGSGYNYAVSYNRPFTDEELPGGFGTYNFVFHAEYPMIRFLERNGYDVSYLTHVDLDQNPSTLLNHKILMDSGHDEYWSAAEVAAVKAAQNAGVSCAFFSGNEMYWEIRWQNSEDGSNTPYRTEVCYKESFAGNPDPKTPPMWTGTWMDPAGAGTGGYLPGNAVTGTLFMVNRGPNDLGGPLTVPYLDSQYLFWANTSVAQLGVGQQATLGDYEVGYEWDEDVDNGFRPSGLIDLSSTTQDAPQVILDRQGITFGAAVATNSQTLFRTKSGALVFGAGTVQWAWGLDSVHDDGPSVVVPALQQATVNLFAMMGAQPATLMAGLVPGPSAAQMDTTAPVSTITSVGSGFPFVQTGATYEITGTATDAGGGKVAGVEISTDGGTTWHPATPTGNGGNNWSTWSFNWTPTTAGTVTIESRAANDSSYLETPADPVSVTVKLDSTTPPQVANISAALVSNTSAAVAWITDKASTSQVIYGTSSQNLNLSVSNSTLVSSHSITLTGLTPNTTYYYQVVSADSHGNTTTAPSSPMTFVSPAFLDTTATFGAGTTANTLSSQTGIILPGANDYEFTGTTLPAGWTSSAYATGGSATVGNSVLTVNGALAQSSTAAVPGNSLQFEANFGGAPYQIIGLASNLNNGPWAIFSTGSAGNALYAQSSVNGTANSTLVEGSNLIGATHVFRIDWTASSVNFWIDGSLVASQAAAIATTMKPVASVLNVGSGNTTQVVKTDDGTVTLTVGSNVAVNWMRVAPYSSPGTYTSRVFDAGTQVTWKTFTWNSVTPPNTTLTMYVRMGNTATPDSSWTDFLPVAGFGPVLGTYSRYLQYQAVLSTTDPDQTPSLVSVGITYSSGASTTPPVIVSSSPNAGNSAMSFSPSVVVEFSDLMNQATVNSNTFYLRASGASSNVPATVSFSAGSTAVLVPSALLSANTTYNVTVSGSVTDASGNPLGSNFSWSFNTPLYSSLTDTTATFASGTTVSNTLVISTGVTLAPTVGVSFTGTSLPTGWTVTLWGSGGSGTVANGVLTVDGVLVGTNNYYSPGRSMQFVANFSGDQYQHAGLATDLNGAPWAIFSTKAGGALYARTNNGATSTDTLLAGNWLGTQHLFRIDWSSSSVTYWIDGNQVASHVIPIGGNMRPIISDYAAGGGNVAVGSVELSPFGTPGTFLSRVFDAGQPVTWNSLQWTDSVPASTSLAMYVRMGNTPVPDSTWTDFIPAANSGAVVGGSSRYLQYQAVLSSNDPNQAPVLSNVTIQYTTNPDTIPPTVVSQTPASGASGADPTAPIVVKFSELMNAGTMNGSTITLQASGSSSNVPATVTFSGSTAVLTPASPLLSFASYTVTLSGTIADSSGNALGSNVSWSFTTRAITLTDTTTADFGAGTLTNTSITQMGNGEVILAPAAASEFSGSILPAGWTSSPWASGGSSTVANGSVTVDGALLATSSYFSPGGSLDFVATFSGDAYQHIGLATDFSGAPWAIFSTMGGGALYARTNNGATSSDLAISGNWLGAPHHFRIDWNSSGFIYWIDGTQVASTSIAITANMRPVISDANVGGGNVVVDWMHLTPYAPSGTFVSRVFDAGTAVTWTSASWTSSAPNGTSLGMYVRMGNTPTPDSSWTDYVPLSSSGATIGGSARFIQYEASLATTASGQTPVLDDVTLNYTIASDTIAPRVVSESPAANATGVNLLAPITVEFSELMNASSITGSAIWLTASGSTTPVAATLTYAGSTATLTPAVALAGNTVYTVNVAGSISDASGNPLGSLTISFTTGVGSWTQSSAADFAAGTLTNTTLATGGLQLGQTAALRDDFSGAGLSSSWSSTSSGGGTSSVTLSGGILSLSATEIDSVTTFNNSPVEGSINFGAGPWQHFGMATSLGAVAGNYWAIFSTFNTSNTLYARVNVNGATQDISLGALPTGFHTYKIQPVSGGLQFLVDGVLQTTVSATFPTTAALKLVMSNYNGAPSLQADWVQVDSYVSSGTFTSSVFDATRIATWGTINWNAILPAGTTITVQTQSGNTATPDSSWSSWSTVSNGGTITSPSARYLRYRVIITTTDPTVTALFQNLTINWI